jgi:cytokinin dehydrogenase
MAINFPSSLIVKDPTLVDEVSGDFGRIIYQKAQAVARPTTYSEVVQVVQFAKENQIPLAMRGQGHSSFGQAQVSQGIVIDSRSLQKIHNINNNENSIVVDAGTTWRQVVEYALMYKKQPKVLTAYLDLSIGGVLSVGGIAGAAQLHGTVADNVLALQVVTGNGQRQECSPLKNSELFWSVLGGLGQFGLIVQATIALCEAPEYVIRYRLVYRDLQAYLNAHRTAVREQSFLSLEGYISFTSQRGWVYMLEAVQPFIDDSTPDKSRSAQKLKPSSIEVDKIPYSTFLNRVEELALYWQVPETIRRPWFDVFLPDSTIETFLSIVLQEMQSTGVFLAVACPLLHEKLTCPFLRTPNETIVWTFDLLRSSQYNHDHIDEQLVKNRRLFEIARDLGGYRYPISAIPFEDEDWKRHYGELWDRFRERKQAYDPTSILTLGQGIKFN